MAIRTFKDQELERFFETGHVPRNVSWIFLAKIVKRKLDMLQYAAEIKDLQSPPNNRLERLKGKLSEYYSIRINDQWRIIFKWKDEPFDVQIIDYH